MDGKYKSTSRLARFYEEAWGAGVWIQEYGLDAQNLCVAMAGTRKALEELERKIGREVEWMNFKYGDGIEIGGAIGRGQSRLAACRRAFKAIKKKMRQEAS